MRTTYQQLKDPRRCLSLQILSNAFVLVGLYIFSASFFLAKRSIEQSSTCNEADILLYEQLGLSINEINTLKLQGIISQNNVNQIQTNRQGCWMDRRVDSLIILLVDALRFDFAYYNLPESIGRRLQHINDGKSSSSRLFQFIADPPTVTMQRLKALTTGGLPTFADISGNFGGAKVPEDTWLKQLLKLTDYRSRGLKSAAKAGFVGDDTWEDLFPTYFTESYPYPSFNTRDLETVDNGCLLHLPELLQKLRTTDESESELEVVVVHFLGVDHVGHTYGPHNVHMDAKLRQMDGALQSVLELLDKSDRCHTALIFGDHGMTEDGNHGGGTTEETHAALFVHNSPACGATSDIANLEQHTSSEWISQSFATLHQIDLVPVISFLLGLPVPFANVGGLLPSLLPGQSVQQMTAALALNAAQVWRYLSVYSDTANRLPNLNVLRDQLQDAVATYKVAMLHESDVDGVESVDLDKYIQASGLFKSFLSDALSLGQRVWTRFDNFGMMLGISVVLLGLILYSYPLFQCRPYQTLCQVPKSQIWESLATLIFTIFICGLLSFSNSYILNEESGIMFSLTVLCFIIAIRMQTDPNKSTLIRGVALLPVSARLNELFISGHGLDPSVRMHLAHNSGLFLLSLCTLALFRWFLYRRNITVSIGHALADCLALTCFAFCWWEKRNTDPNRNGYVFCQSGLILIVGGFFVTFLRPLSQLPKMHKTPDSIYSSIAGPTFTLLAKTLIAIMAVTGPSAASSLVVYTFQALVVYRLAMVTGPYQVNSYVLAYLWRLVTRHMFFATNHGCYFNRLQYSAAFIATKEFYFVSGGISLFLNTFGWEMVGILFAWLMSQRIDRSNIFYAYSWYQLFEALASCISVVVLRRHLMVWDIFAPHFLFAAIYTVLHVLSQLTVVAITFITSQEKN